MRQDGGQPHQEPPPVVPQQRAGGVAHPHHVDEPQQPQPVAKRRRRGVERLRHGALRVLRHRDDLEAAARQEIREDVVGGVGGEHQARCQHGRERLEQARGPGRARYHRAPRQHGLGHRAGVPSPQKASDRLQEMRLPARAAVVERAGIAGVARRDGGHRVADGLERERGLVHVAHAQVHVHPGPELCRDRRHHAPGRRGRGAAGAVGGQRHRGLGHGGYRPGGATSSRRLGATSGSWIRNSTTCARVRGAGPRCCRRSTRTCPSASVS